MKKILYPVAALIFLASCSNSTTTTEATTETVETTQDEASGEDVIKVGDYTAYGAVISPDGAMSAEEFLASLEGKDSVRVKVMASVTSACEKKGCWMKLNMGENADEMRVKFKDYAFFVPLDAAGSEAIVEGIAYVETTSVDELKHYAEDAGKTPEEIAMINAPETKVTFMADGVLLK